MTIPSAMAQIRQVYDPTAGWVQTPNGAGKFVTYDAQNGTVLVEHDFEHLTEYDAGTVYVVVRGEGRP